MTPTLIPRPALVRYIVERLPAEIAADMPWLADVVLHLKHALTWWPVYVTERTPEGASMVGHHDLPEAIMAAGPGSTFVLVASLVQQALDDGEFVVGLNPTEEVRWGSRPSPAEEAAVRRASA